jgi:hypothetical protein
MKKELMKIQIQLIDPSPAPSPSPEEQEEADRYAYELDMGELLSEEERNREDCSYEYHGVRFCE